MWTDEKCVKISTISSIEWYMSILSSLLLKISSGVVDATDHDLFALTAHAQGDGKLRARRPAAPPGTQTTTSAPSRLISPGDTHTSFCADRCAADRGYSSLSLIY